jgi:phosphatidylglycerophosphate synthase
MSKLSAEQKFIDVSDYGRTIAIACAQKLKHTKVTAIHITLLFAVCGLLAVYCILNGYYNAAGFFLILKSIIDAIDGELARAKQTPSYIGRYLDSVFDNILNFLFFMSICYVTHSLWWLGLIAYACIQLQGTLYNFYYVILRTNTKGGDTTSKIFETKRPIALLGENQKMVNVLFIIYLMLYGIYDKIMYALDRKAHKVVSFPIWFMTMISIYGLGFQLLIMAIMLAFGLIDFIIPFFICYLCLLEKFFLIKETLLNKI